MDDYQFELDGYLFGIGAEIATDADGFQPGGSSFTIQDSASPIGDVTFFGRDRLEGPTWAWNLHTDKTMDAESAIAAKRAIAKVWRADRIRKTPRAVLPLRYQLAGEVRRCYGRPRNFSAAPDNAILNGMLPMTCDFKVVEPYFYTDEVRTRSLTTVAAHGGGFVFDLVFPISTAAGEARAGMLEAAEVGGDTDTPFEAVIHGPITNPTIEHGGWKIEIVGTVAYDQTVTVSTLPWDMKARRSDGLNMELSAKTRLSSSFLSADGGEVKFGGTDGTGTARLDLSWRPRWADW